MSTSTGTGDCSTSAANVASVTVTGLPPMGIGALHRPHTGSRPCSLGQRHPVAAPHAGQRIISVSLMSVSRFL